MKTKAIVAITVTMLLVFSAFSVLPVRAVDYVKIGIIGPVGWPQYDGMYEGAELAKDWINGPGGGIVIDGTRYDVSLHYGDEHAADNRPDLGALEMERLIVNEGVDFVIGGFRTESTRPMREVAMNYNKTYFIAGSSTNNLIDCGAGTCGACVRCDYARYKYLFRITPINGTMLVYNLLGFVSGYVLPYRLAPLYGSPIKTGVLMEDLDWTNDLWAAIVLGGYLGPQADIVYAARTAYTPGSPYDFTGDLDAMHAAEVRLVVQIYSAGDSIALVQQMAAHPLKAVLTGIDVVGQTTDFWTWTGGTCQHETFLASTGTRTPTSTTSLPYTTTQLWDLYYSAYGHAPIYTSWGVYDGVISIKELLEANTIHPPIDIPDANALVPLIEATDREGVLGKFKYTTHHDPYSVEYGSDWPLGYVRAVLTQWQAGRLEVVWPMDQPYSKVWSLPDETGSMYPYPSDVLQDGEVGLWDALTVRGSFGGYPAAPSAIPHPTWQYVADAERTAGPNVIDVFDALAVRADYGKTVALPLAYCNEAGQMS